MKTFSTILTLLLLAAAVSCSYRLYRIIGAPEGYRSVNPHFITDLNPN